MRNIFLPILLLISFRVLSQNKTEHYSVDSASVEHIGVPKGEIIKGSFEESVIFPGTSRDYWVYVPSQYKPDKPACVYVNQDGIQWNAPTVFDNLIFQHEMPITIGIFITPGIVKPANTSDALGRYNRSFEYDGLGDRYARFLLEEILPLVEKMHTADGRQIKLSHSGNDRAIGGSSSGAVCAFTAAWERPNEFSRVFSAVGTYVGLRGADRYPTLVRKYETRPLRIFLQDGSNDLNIYAGDWWMANQTMKRALEFSGYEVKNVWGEGGHNGDQGTAVFPDAMRWLWKDWPGTVQTHQSKNQMLSDLLIPGEDWELVGKGYRFTEGAAVNAQGEVYYQDVPNSKTYKVDNEGKLTELKLDGKKASGTTYGPDGRRYTAGASKQVLAYDSKDKETVIADGIDGNDITVAANGNIYVTSPDGIDKPSKIYLIKPDGKKIVVDEGLRFANGIVLTPDQTQLYISESVTHWVWIYRINTDGTLGFKQQYGWLHSTDQEGNAWPDGLRCDTAGRVFVTSRLGIQIMDQTGRVNAIIPIPTGQASNICFGGKNFDELYVTAGDKVYRRKLRTRGANNFERPYKSIIPRL